MFLFPFNKGWLFKLKGCLNSFLLWKSLILVKVGAKGLCFCFLDCKIVVLRYSSGILLSYYQGVSGYEGESSWRFAIRLKIKCSCKV